MTCGFVSRGKLAETESVIPAVPALQIARQSDGGDSAVYETDQRLFGSDSNSGDRQPCDLGAVARHRASDYAGNAGSVVDPLAFANHFFSQIVGALR